MIPQTSTAARLASPVPHLHVDAETCPWCEQEIPPEKYEEISGKIAARERDQARALTAKLEQQHAAEKAQAEAKARTDLEAERGRSAEREAAAREEARQAAEAAGAEKLAAAEHSRQQLQAALQLQLEQADEARKAAEQNGADLQAQMQQAQIDNAAALEALKAEAQAREDQIRVQAQQTADAAVARKLADIEAARAESESALQAQINQATEDKIAAEEAGEALRSQLDALLKAKDAEVAKLKDDATAEADRIRQEAAEAAETRIREAIEDRDLQITTAKTRIEEVEGKLTKLAEEQDAIVNERLGAQREILEKAKDEAVNAEKAKAFDENQKLSNKVNELQRALEKKTNEELGEGAEIDLFEALRAEFPDDRIERVKKGEPGADIVHVVRRNGKDCGTIIYDSKNHNAFRNDHVTKLRSDQLAARAEHAILSTHKFPAGKRQLHQQDGVLLANPARVVAVVTLLRQHLLQTHTLRLSNADREKKTAELYAFVTSERCNQLLNRIDTQAGALLDHQVAEKKWHETAWKKEGELIRGIQKAKADLSGEIGGIIGTAADHEPVFADAEALL